MNAAERNRLINILARLGSDADGERAAAALLATRLVQGAGLTWADLITAPIALSTWRSDLEICGRHATALSEWEIGFVATLARQTRATAKQRAVLAEIAADLRARGCR